MQSLDPHVIVSAYMLGCECAFIIYRSQNKSFLIWKEKSEQIYIISENVIIFWWCRHVRLVCHHVVIFLLLMCSNLWWTLYITYELSLYTIFSRYKSTCILLYEFGNSDNKVLTKALFHIWTAAWCMRGVCVSDIF